MGKITPLAAIIVTVLPALVSTLFMGEIDTIVGKVGIISMGTSCSLLIFLFGVTFTPKLMPGQLWSKHTEAGSTTYRFNAGPIFPLFTLSTSIYILLSSFEPRLVATSHMGATPLLGMLGILAFTQSAYKLYFDRSTNLDLKIDGDGITIGNVDYSKFDADSLESIKPGGRSLLFPRLEINGRGIQTSGSWRPGKPKSKTIHRQTLAGMSLGHWEPQEVSREIHRLLKS